MNSQKPKKIVFRPSKPQLCSHLYKETEGGDIPLTITWLPRYENEAYEYAHHRLETAVYTCSLSGAVDCNYCLSNIYKKDLSKLGLKLKSKGPVEYIEYTCPGCVKGQTHKFPKMPGTKHYMHWSHYGSVDAVFYVLEIKKDGSLAVGLEKVNIPKRVK